jgi:hypothetical protein
MKAVSIAAGLALATVSSVALLGAETTTPTPRMSYSESSAIKRSMIPPGHTMSEYELDHIVPLCLGGSNNSSNLQLQPWAEARKKDELELLACKAVRSRRLNVEQGRALFTNWRTSYKEVFGVEP